MRFLNLFDDEPQRRASEDGDPASDDPLGQARSDADRLLAAGDEAIRRALSGGNSEAFLRAGRQEGGE